MKTIIGLDGVEKEVADSVPVKTVNGKHYELSQSDLDEINVKESKALSDKLRDLPNQLRKEEEKKIVNIDGVEERGDEHTLNALSKTVQFLTILGPAAPTVINWSAINGFHSLSPDQIKNLGIQLGLRHQKGFSARKILQEEIQNGTITTVESARTRFNQLMQ